MFGEITSICNRSLKQAMGCLVLLTSLHTLPIFYYSGMHHLLNPAMYAQRSGSNIISNLLA
jgi:hypothetical protein